MFSYHPKVKSGHGIRGGDLVERGEHFGSKHPVISSQIHTSPRILTSPRIKNRRWTIDHFEKRWHAARVSHSQ